MVNKILKRIVAPKATATKDMNNKVRQKRIELQQPILRNLKHPPLFQSKKAPKAPKTPTEKGAAAAKKATAKTTTGHVTKVINLPKVSPTQFLCFHLTLVGRFTKHSRQTHQAIPPRRCPVPQERKSKSRCRRRLNCRRMYRLPAAPDRRNPPPPPPKWPSSSTTTASWRPAAS